MDLDAVLFDLDGTLLDSVPLIVESFHHAFSALGQDLPPPSELARAIGIPLREFFTSLGKSPYDVEALIGAYRAHNLAHHDARVRAYDGVVEMVAEVRRRGLHTAIVTSKNAATARRGLEITGLAGTMDVIVSCDEVVRPKPHPEPVLRALEWLGVLPSRAVFLGDSLHDLHSGRAARVHTAAALWGPFAKPDLEEGRPDFWLARPLDLLALLPESSAA